MSLAVCIGKFAMNAPATRASSVRAAVAVRMAPPVQQQQEIQERQKPPTRMTQKPPAKSHGPEDNR